MISNFATTLVIYVEGSKSVAPKPSVQLVPISSISEGMEGRINIDGIRTYSVMTDESPLSVLYGVLDVLPRIITNLATGSIRFHYCDDQLPQS